MLCVMFSLERRQYRVKYVKNDLNNITEDTEVERYGSVHNVQPRKKTV